VYAWEAKPYPKWWDRVPEADRPSITFYNEPVNATEASALGVLRQTARPDDFVVLKLDIDTPVVENAIVDAMLRDDALLALVDEFLFEFHVSNEDIVRTALQGMRMMGEMRKRGVRAHFWV